jgi:hypothetical protein
VSTASLQYLQCLQCLQEFPEFADAFSGGHVAVIYSPPPILIRLSGLWLFQLDSSKSNWNLWSPTRIQIFHWIPLDSSEFQWNPPLATHHLTHAPPHKQLLMRLGVGGVSSPPSFVPPSPPHCSPIRLLAPIPQPNKHTPPLA